MRCQTVRCLSGVHDLTPRANDLSASGGNRVHHELKRLVVQRTEDRIVTSETGLATNKSKTSALPSHTGPPPESAERDHGPKPDYVQEHAVGERRLPRNPEGLERTHGEILDDADLTRR